MSSNNLLHRAGDLRQILSSHSTVVHDPARAGDAGGLKPPTSRPDYTSRKVNEDTS